MAPYIGQLGAFGIAPEVTLGTWVAPTVFIPVHLPISAGSPDIDLIESKGLTSIPDIIAKTAQGRAYIKSIKGKFDVEPENGIGQLLKAAMGVDTMVEVVSFLVSTGVNDTFDFNIGASQLSFAVATGTYKAGQTQADTGTLCQLIYAGLVAQDGSGTYTVSFSRATGEFTITRSTGTFVLMFHTGTNTAKTIAPLLGFITSADQSGADTYTGTIVQHPPFSHTFSKLASAQMPSYSTWCSEGGLDYPSFAGCMLNKLDIEVKAGQYVTCDFDFVGSAYQSGETSQSVAYSPLAPLKFNQAVVKIAGTQINDYTDLKLSVDNMVKCDAVVGGSIYSNIIAADGMKVSVSATVIVENTTEWAKFLAGTTSSVQIILTSQADVLYSVPYSLTVTVATIAYKSAPRPLKNGKLEITFQADGVVSSGATISMVLVNSISTAF